MIWLWIPTLLWAFSFGIIKHFLQGIDPVELAFVRLGLATLFFLPFIGRGGDWNVRLRYLMLGLLQFGLMYGCLFHSFRYLKGYEVALFTLMTPLYVICVNDFLERRISYLHWLAALLAVAGAAIIQYKGLNDPSWRGILWLQGSNLSFATGQVLYRRMRMGDAAAYPDAFRVAWMYLGGAILCAGWLLVAGDPTLGTVIHPDAPWAWLLYLGVVASGVGFFCWNRGARVVKNPGVLAVMNNAYIPMAILVNLGLFGEEVDMFRLIPGTIVLGLSLLLVWRIEHRPVR